MKSDPIPTLLKLGFFITFSLVMGGFFVGTLSDGWIRFYQGILVGWLGIMVGLFITLWVHSKKESRENH